MPARFSGVQGTVQFPGRSMTAPFDRWVPLFIRFPWACKSACSIRWFERDSTRIGGGSDNIV